MSVNLSELFPPSGGSSGSVVEEAPTDGKLYGRQSEAWEVVPDDFLSEAPDDGKQYARQNEAWEIVDKSLEVSSTEPAAPNVGDQWFNSNDGYLYVWYDSGATQQWVAIGGTA